MKIAIETLQPGPDISKKLEKDGWTVEQVDGGLLLAEHPSVSNESLARLRLHQLGLLTSGQLRIHFDRLPIAVEA